MHGKRHTTACIERTIKELTITPLQEFELDEQPEPHAERLDERIMKKPRV